MTVPSSAPDTGASLTLWVNIGLSDAGRMRLLAGMNSHRVVFAADAPAGLAEADIAFGQPDPETLLSSPRLRWAQLTSAGYTRYDRDDLRAALQARGATLTNSSHVYDEPCAQHIVAMLLAVARQLPQAMDVQRTDHSWPTGELRSRSFLVGPETTIVLLGFGAIARRVVELLRPFGPPRLIAVRRRVGEPGPDGVTVVAESDVERVLPLADHVFNILPESPTTRGFLGAERLSLFKQGAFLYNIGRGATVDQEALLTALQSGHLGGAYLDVTTPEPLPPDHPLWTAPNCWITPHSAGGHIGEEGRLIDHFLANLRRFERGESLHDKVA